MPSDFGVQAENGFKLFLQAKFSDATALLGPLVENARQNSGAFAKDTTLREHMRKAMIALALAQSRGGDLGAMRGTFAEYVRSFSDASVPKAVYGPDAAQAFDDVRKEVLAGGMGKLTVRTVETGSVVFVDEAYRGSGTTTVELPAGEYRVVVMANDQPSRTHFVTVHAGGEATAVVDAAFDQAVHTTGWTGFQFATAAAREAHEAAYAAQFAHAIGAHSVALVGIDTVKGRSAVVGSLISLDTGREIRRASVQLDPDPSTEHLKALAKYVTGEPAGDGVEVLDTNKVVEHPTTGAPHHEIVEGQMVTVDRRWGGYRWIALGATIGLGGTSAALYYLNGKCKGEMPMTHGCINLYANAPYDHDFLFAAIPFAIASVYLFATQTKQVPLTSAYVVPTEHGALAGFATSW